MVYPLSLKKILNLLIIKHIQICNMVSIMASPTIPLIFQPLYDTEHKIIYVMVEYYNNPIKYALLNTIKINDEKKNENNNPINNHFYNFL